MHKGLVVVVEADDLLRQLLERWLREAGYAVRLDGAAAREPAPSVVVAAVAAPQQAAAEVQALQLRYHAPIVLLSARFRAGLAGSGDVAQRLGVRRVLPKPFSRKELLAAVHHAIAV